MAGDCSEYRYFWNAKRNQIAGALFWAAVSVDWKRWLNAPYLPPMANQRPIKNHVTY